jgi:D-alanyl-D-alanine carboxypeptidase
MTRAVLACLAVAAVAATGASAKHQPSPLQQGVDALVAAGAPGVVLVVRDGGKTTRLTGGLGEIATSTPMRAADHYRIASLTKSYVAAVVLQLVGEGTLRLRDTVEHWLPGLVPNGDKITIRQLLNHTSGLQDHERDPVVLAPYFAGDFGYYWPPRSLVEIAVSHAPRFPPGETQVASYSSTNYVIAGLIVESATGNDIGTELKRRLFRPLHLSRTSYPTSETQLPSPYAHGYFLFGPPPLTDLSAFSPSLSGAAGAIVSTADDVADFYRALLSGRVLKPAQLATMKTTLVNPGSDLNQRMGYGLERFPASCGVAWGHSGSFPGYWGHAWSSGDGKRQAVLMVNIDPMAVEPAAITAFYTLLDAAYCSTS